MWVQLHDVQNGPTGDLTDDAIWGDLLYHVAAGDYSACIASPECSTFSKLHNLPGPPPLRDASGPGPYGRKDLSPADKERVRAHTLVAGPYPRPPHYPQPTMDLRGTRGFRQAGFGPQPRPGSEFAPILRGTNDKRSTIPVRRIVLQTYGVVALSVGAIGHAQHMPARKACDADGSTIWAAHSPKKGATTYSTGEKARPTESSGKRSKKTPFVSEPLAVYRTF